MNNIKINFNKINFDRQLKKDNRRETNRSNI